MAAVIHLSSVIQAVKKAKQVSSYENWKQKRSLASGLERKVKDEEDIVGTLILVEPSDLGMILQAEFGMMKKAVYSVYKIHNTGFSINAEKLLVDHRRFFRENFDLGFSNSLPK